MGGLEVHKNDPVCLLVKRAAAMSVPARLDCPMVTFDLRNKWQPISGVDLLIISLSFD